MDKHQQLNGSMASAEVWVGHTAERPGREEMGAQEKAQDSLKVRNRALKHFLNNAIR